MARSAGPTKEFSWQGFGWQVGEGDTADGAERGPYPIQGHHAVLPLPKNIGDTWAR